MEKLNEKLKMDKKIVENNQNSYEQDQKHFKEIKSKEDEETNEFKITS